MTAILTHTSCTVPRTYTQMRGHRGDTDMALQIRSTVRGVGAGLVLVALLATACGNSGSDDKQASDSPTTTAGGTAVHVSGVPGVTDDAINYAAVGTNSNNPLGTCVLDCYSQGIEAYFAYRNSEGGVNGRQLKLTKKLDDQLGQNQVKSLEVVSADDVFGAFGAPQIPNGWEAISKAGIPNYVWGIHAKEQVNHDNIFPSAALGCEDCTGHTASFIAEKTKTKKVASLGYGVSENSKLCASANKRSLAKYHDAVDAEVVYLNDNLPFGLPNGVGPEVSAMKKAGVQLVLACLDLNGMKTIAQELQRQGMDDVILYHPNTYNQSFVKEAGSLFEGDIVSSGFRPFEAASSKGLDAYKKWMAKTKSPLTELAMVGWLNADLAYRGLVAAGPKFDRASVIAATNKITNWNADGLLNPVDWTKQHLPTTETDRSNGYAKECVALVKVVKGAFVTVGPKDKPWFCWPGNSTTWSEPVPTNFG
jgi:hypothetical protein